MLMSMSFSVSISCGDCSMQHTAACDDCVVNFVLNATDVADAQLEHSSGGRANIGIDLDRDQERVVHLFAKAGLVPVLRFDGAVA